MARRFTQESFIEAAKEVHGDKYKYDLVDYVNLTRTKVRVVCPAHGEFLQYAHDHLAGKGCNGCAIQYRADKGRWDTPEFVRRSMLAHGDRFDYSKVCYKDSITPVVVVCKKHGEFLATPSNHVSGTVSCGGCNKKTYYEKGKQQTIDDFLIRSKQVHGGKYDYSRVDYRTVNDKVDIICVEHGTFSISPAKHYSGTGCARCAQLATGKYLRKSTEDFIRDAKRVHGDRYDYSNVQYTTNTNKVRIICREHGEWLAPPNKHLLGTGCHACAKAGFDSTKVGSVYVLVSGNTTKVGITNRKVSVRCTEIGKSSSKDFTILSEYSMSGKDCALIENEILAELRQVYLTVPERYSGSTESFLDVDRPALLTNIDTKIKAVYDKNKNATEEIWAEQREAEACTC